MKIGIDASAMLIAQKNGYENYVTNLILTLAALPSSEFEGLELFLYFYAGNVLADSNLFGKYKPQLGGFKLRVYPFRRGFPQALNGMCFFDRLDLIHLPVYIWSTKFPCRVITTFHDACHQRAFLDGLVDEVPQDLVNTINRQIHVSNAFITVSNSSKRDLCEFYGIEESRVSVVYHGVSDEFQYNERIAELVREKFGINRYILSVNSIQGNKNHLRLLEAYGQLFRQGLIDQNLVLVGRNGWGCDRIYKALRDIGLDEQIHVLGYVTQEELIGLYSGADIVVNASLCEGFGLPILEAMACGAIIAASNNTALGEVGGEAVFGFDPYDVTSISNAIHEALFNAEARKIKQLASQAQIQKFSWERAASQTLNVFQSLLG